MEAFEVVKSLKKGEKVGNNSMSFVKHGEFWLYKMPGAFCSSPHARTHRYPHGDAHVVNHVGPTWALI